MMLTFPLSEREFTDAVREIAEVSAPTIIRAVSIGDDAQTVWNQVVNSIRANGAAMVEEASLSARGRSVAVKQHDRIDLPTVPSVSRRHGDPEGIRDAGRLCTWCERQQQGQPSNYREGELRRPTRVRPFLAAQRLIAGSSAPRSTAAAATLTCRPHQASD